MVDFERIESRFEDFSETLQGNARDSRVLCTAITWNMAKEKPVFGWGAGSWRYIFPRYQQYYPRLFYKGYHPGKGGWHGHRIYHQAHNDIVEFFYQFGIVGCSFLVSIWLFWIYQIGFRSKGNTMAALMLFIGICLACAHAYADFIFQSPAYWVAFNGLCCIAVKLLVLHRERQLRAS